ncbi:MAG: anthranilate phosphoribosyltransferase [Thermoguttaceae bacterium]|jgi:anthranilate phosphoribosyltransferase|nr:anthranilate phosphoribosyltransferase [Thermoguttaceae bacterium]
MLIENYVQLMESGQDLAVGQMTEAIRRIMSGEVPAELTAQFLAALHRKGETVAEVAGAAAAMRECMLCIQGKSDRLIDVVGTGGDSSGTFNISTTAAIVTAACGVPVAKHGNRAVTSRSGASDVLAQLGVNIEAALPRVQECLAEVGICFCFAPLYHLAMKHVAPVRRQLPHPTVFNLLGPLANPASAPFQLLGVGRAELRPLLAEAIGMLGTRRTLVVYGTDGLDEVTLGGTTEVTEVGPEGLRHWEWAPSDFGLPHVTRDRLQVQGPEESAARIEAILLGETGPARDVVLANVGAALWTVGLVDTLPDGVRQAAEAIDSGAARAKLGQLVEVSCRA